VQHPAQRRVAPPVIGQLAGQLLRSRARGRRDDEVRGEVVVLGLRVAEGDQGTVRLGEERRQDVAQERLLQLAHVRVELPVGLPVPLDVEEKSPPRISAGASG